MKGTCLNCEHFIYKLMLNGYHGMCDAKPAGEICFVRFDDSCDKWDLGEGGQSDEEEEGGNE